MGGTTMEKTFCALHYILNNLLKKEKEKKDL
jgi:hypothetical protein